MQSKITDISIDKSEKQYLTKENLLKIVLIYNQMIDTEYQTENRAAEFKKQVFSNLRDNKIDLNLLMKIQLNVNEIYNKLSSAYKEKPIPLDEINSYFQNGQTRSFIDYICCCKRRRNANPIFVGIISTNLSNDFIVTQEGEIITQDEAVDRFMENAM
jgi:hypothetical protein